MRSKIVQYVTSIDYFQIITTTIAIVAFLLGIEYFSDRSELKMSVQQHIPRFSTYYQLQDIEDFYLKNKISLPEVIRNDQKYGYLFKTDPQDDFIGLYESTPYYIKNYLKDGKIDSVLLDFFSDSLFAHLDSYRYKEDKIEVNHRHSFDIKEVLSHYKKLLSDEEYYLFIAAVLRTREIQNSIFFDPMGNVEFYNIRIEIHSPNSFVNKNRSNNLKRIKFASNFDILYMVQGKDDYKIIEIPKLYKEQKFSFIVYTRENFLTEREVKLSYDYKPYKDNTEIWFLSGLIFIILLLLHILQIYKKLKKTEKIAE
jgi:hypothetical protein